MLFIHEKINSSSSRKIAAKDIWDHLNSMYDLQALVKTNPDLLVVWRDELVSYKYTLSKDDSASNFA